jgi:hypothetical protein
MDFVDKTLVRLADESTRGAVFGQDALELLLEAAYDTPALGIEGPFGADFADFRLGWWPGALGTLDGTWNVVGAPDRTEARFRLSGMAADGLPRIDAIWLGSITARHRVGGEPITAVATQPPQDDSIAATVTFAEPAPVSQTAQALPVSVALLIRGEFAVTDALHEAGIVRDRLATLGIERAADRGLTPRHRLVVCLVVPEAVFDDADWPGATSGTSPAEQRTARRAAASGWLAREGIGLVSA